MKGKTEGFYRDPKFTRLQGFFDKKILDEQIIPRAKTLGDRALDVGCYDGEFTQYFAKQLAINVRGIDKSKTMIEVAKKLESQTLSFDVMDIAAPDFHLYCQYPIVISLMCLHWVLEQNQALKNIYSALDDSGLGFLFVSALSSISPTKLSYVDLLQQLIKEEPHNSYFSEFNITRAHITSENYPTIIEEAGLELKELVTIDEPFIFEDREELSRFFQDIASRFLVFKGDLSDEEKGLHTASLCDDLVKKLIELGHYIPSPDGSISSMQHFLLAIVQKPGKELENLSSLSPK